jgi:hypothetical protein
MVEGETVLNEANDVDVIAIDSNGATQFNDIDDLSVGVVTAEAVTADRAMTAMNGTVDAAAVPITGIRTSDDDVKLTAAGNLTLDEGVVLGGGDLLLDVDGDVTQLDMATINVAGLGLMVDGVTVLDAANDVTVLAVNNQSDTDFNDVNDILIGTVVIEEVVSDRAMTAMNGAVDAAAMSITGITTSDDNVGLQAGGDLTQVFGDPTAIPDAIPAANIVTNGLALEVTGTTRLLNLGNDVVVIAANNTGQILYRDSNDLAVGTVATSTRNIAGISTTSTTEDQTLTGTVFEEVVRDLDNTIQVDSQTDPEQVRFNPGFDGYLRGIDATNTISINNINPVTGLVDPALDVEPNLVGIGLISGGTLDVNEAVVSPADIILSTRETAADPAANQADININGLVQTDAEGNVLVVAADEATIDSASGGQILRGTDGIVFDVSVLNSILAENLDLILQPNDSSDPFAFVDADTFTQNFEYIFGEDAEQQFRTSVFFGIELERFELSGFDTTSLAIDFLISSQDADGGGIRELNPDTLAQLRTILFDTILRDGGASQFESRSFYIDPETGNTLFTQTSQPIGNDFDIGEGGINPIDTASFSFEFLNLNPQFRNIAFVFNDSNINLFENASDPDALRDLNVAAESFEGVAVIGRAGFVVAEREEIEVVEQIEPAIAVETQTFQSVLVAEEPLFVQTVQQTKFIVVYFESQAEAELFETSFEDLAGESGDVDYGELEGKFEELFKQIVQFDNIDDTEDAFDANQIREIFEAAKLDLDGDDEDWAEQFRKWLESRDSNDESPEVPRGLFKIIEVENGKAIIRGDDIDRRFVPEPGDDSDAKDYEFVEPGEEEPADEARELPLLESTSNATDAPVSDRVARWTRLLEGESSDQQVDVASPVVATSSMALLALACKRNAREGRSAEDEIEHFAKAKLERPGKNIFSKAARFARRHKSNLEE